MKDKVELVAETLWRSEYRRATGKERGCDWSEIAEVDQEKYRYVSRDVLKALEIGA